MRKLPNEEKKGITVKIHADLHAEVRRYFFGFCKLLNIFLYLLIGKRTDAFSGIPGNKDGADKDITVNPSVVLYAIDFGFLIDDNNCIVLIPDILN